MIYIGFDFGTKPWLFKKVKDIPLTKRIMALRNRRKKYKSHVRTPEYL